MAIPLTLISSVVAAASAIVNWYGDIEKNPDGLTPVQKIDLLDFRKRLREMEKAITLIKNFEES